MVSDLALAYAGNPRAVIGSNQPPEEVPTPYDLAVKAVEDVYAETILWLDGHAINSQEMADGVANLLAMIRAAEKQADDARIAEKEPLDERVKEIQARYAPLIGNTKTVKGKTVLAAEACKSALQPWLDAEDKRIKEAARLAREEADRQAREAAEALRASEVTDLAARAEAEALVAAAKKADTAANVAARKTATAGGAFGRSAALRTVYRAEITDVTAFARYLWSNDHDEMLAYLNVRAKQLVDAGQRAIPGVTVHEDKRAV